MKNLTLPPCASKFTNGTGDGVTGVSIMADKPNGECSLILCVYALSVMHCFIEGVVPS